MNASRFVNKNIIDALDNYQNYERHQKKLKSIKKELDLKKQGKLKVIDEEDEHLKMRVISNKLKSHEFNDGEKILEIQKQNQKMMQKLYEISQGKQSTLKHLLGDSSYNNMITNHYNSIQSQQESMQQNEINRGVGESQLSIQGQSRLGSMFLKQNQSQMKSLHMPYKKKEAQRIDQENQRMIERIMNANSALPVKKLEEEFQQHLKIKKNLQKSQPIPVEKIIQKKNKQYEGLESQILPPINSSAEQQKRLTQRTSSENKTNRDNSIESQSKAGQQRGVQDNTQKETGGQAKGSVTQLGNSNNKDQNQMKVVKSHSVLPPNKASKQLSQVGSTPTTTKNQSQSAIGQKFTQPQKNTINKDIKTNNIQTNPHMNNTQKTVQDQKYETAKIKQEPTGQINVKDSYKSVPINETKNQKQEDDDYEEDEYSGFENDEIGEDNVVAEDDIIDEEEVGGGRITNNSQKGQTQQNQQIDQQNKTNFQLKEFKFGEFKSPQTTFQKMNTTDNNNKKNINNNFNSTNNRQSNQSPEIEDDVYSEDEQIEEKKENIQKHKKDQQFSKQTTQKISNNTHQSPSKIQAQQCLTSNKTDTNKQLQLNQKSQSKPVEEQSKAQKGGKKVEEDDIDDEIEENYDEDDFES